MKKNLIIMANQIEQTVVDPLIINFGLGYPSSKMLPDDLIEESMLSYPNNHHKNSILQYGFVSGYSDFRIKLAELIYTLSDRNVNPEKLFISNGISGSLHLISSMLATKGDCILVEDTSYFIGIRIFESLGFNVISVKTDNNCIDLNILEQDLINGLKPKFFYMIPFNHNPRGYNWSELDKQKLIHLSEKYNFYVVSDEVYEFLHFDEQQPYKSFHQYQNTNVISLNTFSKILAPGIRLGWIEANSDIIQQLKNHPVIVSGGGINPMGCLLVEPLLKSQLVNHIIKLRRTLKERRDVMVDTLNKLFGSSIEFDIPTGGYFIWIKFKENWISDNKFLDDSVNKYQVRFQPGINFNLQKDKFLNCMRLSFSFYTPDMIKVGICRLYDSYRKYLLNVNVIGNVKVIENVKVIDMTPLMVYGATGRLGSEIIKQEALAESLKFRLIGLNRDCSNLLKNGIVIDVSSAKGLKFLLSKLTGQTLIVGTTGDLPVDLIKLYNQTAKVCQCPNFSSGIRLLHQMLNVVNDNWTSDIVELHHKYKKDSPSGTALALSKSVPNCNTIQGIRGGTNYGEHIVFLHQDGEQIEIRHQCLDRTIFATGAIRLASQI